MTFRKGEGKWGTDMIQRLVFVGNFGNTCVGEEAGQHLGKQVLMEQKHMDGIQSDL